MRIYPDCQFITRTIEVGGLTKLQLMEKFQQHSILMNEYAKILLSDDKFITSDTKYSLEIVELNVGNLGFLNGATITQIFKKASELGFELCPLELVPYLRLNYLNQPEGYKGKGNPSQKHKAPYGSVTIASEIVREDDNLPKGLYLRKIDGVLWMRDTLLITCMFGILMITLYLSNNKFKKAKV